MNYESASSVFLNFTILSPYFQLTITQIDQQFYSMNNDSADVDELILEIADTRTTMPIWLPKSFFGSALP